MKVGDYVRNKYGIAKIIDIEDKNGIDVVVFDRNICFLVDIKNDKILDDKLINRLPITEHIDLSKIKSGSLIDVLEVGDYVNGHLIFDKTPYCVYIEDNGNKLAHIPYIEKDIRNVLTKEQYERQMYKKY